MSPSESSTIPCRRVADRGMAASVPVSGQLHAPFALPKDDAQVPADWSNRPVFSQSPARGPAWYQLYCTARDSPGICHFSFLSNFHE